MVDRSVKTFYNTRIQRHVVNYARVLKNSQIMGRKIWFRIEYTIFYKKGVCKKVRDTEQKQLRKWRATTLRKSKKVGKRNELFTLHLTRSGLRSWICNLDRVGTNGLPGIFLYIYG